MNARTRPRRLELALCAALFLAAACRSPLVPTCRRTEVASVMDSLYFGTAKPGGGTVSAEDWQAFLAEVITPRFPDGLTAWNAAGQWRDGNGTLQRESSYVLSVVHPDTPELERSIEEVIARYKSQFGQESVLRVRSPTCVSF
jgi:hypothetical protein